MASPARREDGFGVVICPVSESRLTLFPRARLGMGAGAGSEKATGYAGSCQTERGFEG